MAVISPLVFFFFLRSNISTCLEAAENVPLALNLKQFAAIHNILLRTAQ